MCKHVLVSMDTADSAMTKNCKPAMLGRVWEASRRVLNLEHSPAYQFALCQWQSGQRPTKFYLIYRWLLFITVTSIGIASFSCQRLPRFYKGPKVELNYFKWFIYFTNWGYLCIILQAGLGLIVVLHYGAKKKLPTACQDDEGQTDRRHKTPLICRAYWLAHTVSTDLAFVISVVYWTLVHDPRIHEINALNLLVHGGNSVIMLLELALTAHPVRAAHALYGASAGLAYGVFSAFYWAIGGTDRLGLPAIYPSLDWNKPGSALGFVALCAIVMIFAHGVATVLATLRIRLAARIRPTTPHSDRLTLPTQGPGNGSKDYAWRELM